MLPAVTHSVHGMLCIQIVDPSPAQRWFIRRALRANRIDDPFYTKRQKASPFIQFDEEDYILVEFWTDSRPEVDSYVKWLNSQFDRETLRHLQIFGEYVL